MATYDLGDGVNLRHLVRDRDGNAVDATVALTITLPDGTTTGVTVQRTALGQYDANTYVPLVAGDFSYEWKTTGTVTDVSRGAFTVANPGPATYTTLPAVKSSLGKITVDDRDENIQLAMVAASRMIDASTGRWPGAFRADTVPSMRTFTIAGRVIPAIGYNRAGIMVDDIASTSGIAVGLGTFGGYYASITGFAYGPDNSLAMGRPVEWITLPRASLLGTIDSIQVTARWGWPSTPAEVEMATRLLAARLYKRKDSPQGVIASADWGAVRVSKTDPDVYALISHLSIPGFA